MNSRTPVFYLLPKIHKTNNPDRAVVSSVNSHTEKISACVDDYPRQLAERLPSYIRNFIKRLRAFGKLRFLQLVFANFIIAFSVGLLG